MSFKGYMYLETVNIITCNVGTGESIRGEICFNKSQSESIKNYFESMYNRYNADSENRIPEEYITEHKVNNRGFKITLLEQHGLSRKPYGLGCWQCEVEHVETKLKFKTALTSNSIHSLITEGVVNKGVIEDVVATYINGYQHFVPKESREFKEVIEDSNTRERFRHKTRKWIPGHKYETLTTKEIYIGKIIPKFAMDYTNDYYRLGILENKEVKHLIIPERDVSNIERFSSLVSTTLENVNKRIENQVDAYNDILCCNADVLQNTYSQDLCIEDRKQRELARLLGSTFRLVPILHGLNRLDKLPSKTDAGEVLETDILPTTALINLREQLLSKIIAVCKRFNINWLPEESLNLIFRCEGESNDVLSELELEIVTRVYNYCEGNAKIQHATNVEYSKLLNYVEERRV